MIPQSENPFQYNPERGFVSSANQFPVYPSHIFLITWAETTGTTADMMINRYLNQETEIGIQDMMKLQLDTYNPFAGMARPVLLRNIDSSALNAEETKYLDILKDWDLHYEADAKGPSIFNIFWDSLKFIVWHDELEKDRYAWILSAEWHPARRHSPGQCL